jgi:hypothetical protein
MPRKAGSKQVEMEYCFDRLGGEKLAQIYRLLVPEVMGHVKKEEPKVEYEKRSDLYTSVFGTAERRADHRESSGGLAGVCAG